MDITIDERKFSLRNEYDIHASADDYFAQKKFFSFTNQIEVRTIGGEVLANLESHWSLFRLNYDFIFTAGQSYSFRCVKVWKGVYSCDGSGQSLTVYQHKGLKWSVFNGVTQIAAFTKNRVVVGKGNHYEVRINHDANHLLVICMVLALSTSDDQDNSTITYDAGNIGPEDRPFDESWEPD